MGKIAALVKQLLIEIEGDPIRKDLIETPDRVERALAELLDGYKVDILGLFKSFDNEGTDQIIAIKDIPFVSFCEHHMLIFSGTVDMAYLPNGKVIGASKIPRLVAAYAHRLQIQERLTEQIATTLMENLQPKGVAAIVRASHSCMECRGIKAHGSTMVTSVMLGAFRESQSSRMEVLSLLE